MIDSNFIAAAIQLNSGNDIAANLKSIKAFVKMAASDAAKFITLPENALLMSASKEELYDNSYFMDANPYLKELQELAAKLNIYLLIGSVATKIKESTKLVNRSILINNSGDIETYYDKIHLFDVDLATESHRESERFIAGKQNVIAKLPWLNIGLSICYDIRFPNQYRELALNGAKLITIPAAFTHTTGEAHWHVLTRARAVENGCYIIAPAQCGIHNGKRRTFGHSVIIDPWGKIIAELQDDPGYITAEIVPSNSDRTRAIIPSLKFE